LTTRCTASQARRVRDLTDSLTAATTAASRAREVAVERDDLAAVLDGDGRKVRIGGEIAGCVRRAAEAAQP